MKIKGTLNELCNLYPWDKLCTRVGVDYYKRHLVPADEVFEIDAEDFVRREPELDDCKINMGITFKVLHGFYSHTQQKLIAESLRIKIIDLINDDLFWLDRKFDGIKGLASVNIEHERNLNE